MDLQCKNVDLYNREKKWVRLKQASLNQYFATKNTWPMIISLLTNKSENSSESTNLQEVLICMLSYKKFFTTQLLSIPRRHPPRRNKNAYAHAAGSLAPANWCWIFFFFEAVFLGGWPGFVRSVHVMCSDMLMYAGVFILAWDAYDLQI